MARFVQADTVVPSAGNPQLLNRYSYVSNNPVMYADPTGHDLMIVTGAQTDGTWNNPLEWQEWIMAYKGWNDEEWNVFYANWEDAHDKKGYLNDYGIRFFDWTACRCIDDPSKSYSTEASIEWALGSLEQQMQGMKDITLVGHSKGGNLILHYANSAAALANQELRNIISLNSPQTSPFWLSYSHSKHIDEVIPAESRNYNVINIYNPYDRINDTYRGEIGNALNVSYEVQPDPWDAFGFSPHSVNQRDAWYVLYRTTNITGHNNANYRTVRGH